MANTTPTEIQLWTVLTEKNVKIPVMVWNVWQERFMAVLDQIARIAEASAIDGSIPVDEAKVIVSKVYELNTFVRDIVKSDDQNMVVDGRVYLETTVRQLIAHYIGNDLYKIALIADVSGSDPEPVPSAYAERIVKNVATIREFLQKLKDKTR